MIALVDDRLLGRVLRGEQIPALRRYDVATTGLWYLRLCQAVRHDRGGELSLPFRHLDPVRRDRAITRLLALPTEVAMLSLRDLVPTMADVGAGLNLLSREVLAAAITFPAKLVVSEGNLGPRLSDALGTANVTVTFVATS